MAKYYGSMVGAPSQGPTYPGISNFCKDGRDDILMRDKLALTGANAIGDVISLGTFKATALLSASGCVLWNDALAAGATLNIGDATYASGLAAGVSLAAKQTVSLWQTFGASKLAIPLWQALGYAYGPDYGPGDAPPPAGAVLPGRTIELLATLAGAAPGAGSIAWQILGLNR
ncbi:hypothetical protein [Caulobacter sp. S45]|uniref:hypothetical protein n=1 Tax=Caulobacter sp. S45 TaxID=1641861 RepID=UPI001576ED10|nr:hypothetical protein [Caulobacter sp. S45]